MNQLKKEVFDLVDAEPIRGEHDSWPTLTDEQKVRLENALYALAELHLPRDAEGDLPFEITVRYKNEEEPFDFEYVRHLGMDATPEQYDPEIERAAGNVASASQSLERLLKMKRFAAHERSG